MTNPSPPKGMIPKGLAEEIFNQLLPRVNGDPREATRQAILFLREAILYAAHSSAIDPASRAALPGLLKDLGESIANPYGPPGATGATGAPSPPAPAGKP